MQPERWQLIDRLFHETLNHKRDERGHFLVQACAGDELLRQEVEALIASHEGAESFIETPASALAAELLAKGKTGVGVGAAIGPYTIRSVLGIGGMGEVYLAQDKRLGRQVALKLLPGQFTASPERVRRFELEARAASALNHPNIVTIHEIGETEGTQFIVTEYVEGKTIRDLMSERTIGLIEALDVTIQAASALEAAHKAGIVHRDIKPENMMLRTDGYLKILDFGLAKLTERPHLKADSSFSTQMQIKTNPGMVMGTVQYMSPEQTQGEEIDARTDLWSLGVVLYEMLNGCVPFEGKTTSHVIVSILESEPKPFQREVPSELQRILVKVLRKQRHMRYQSARDLTVDLKNLKQELEVGDRLKSTPGSNARVGEERTEIKSAAAGGRSTSETIRTQASVVYPTSSAEYLVGELKRHKRGLFVGIAALIIGVAVLSSYMISRRAKAPETVDAIDSVAVLPFVNESNDPNAEYLSDGISDSIINRLSQLSNLRVVSLSSALRYKGQAVDAASVGRDLKVRAVLIGWMTKRGDSLSVRTELVDVRDNRRLWGENYQNRQLSDLLQVQEEISRRISEKLRLRLTGEDQRRLGKAATKNSEAFQLYLKGRFYWNKFTSDGFRKSIDFFKQAIAKDPDFGLAYSGLADSYSLVGEFSLDAPKDSFPQARTYAEKALVLDETLADAHRSLGIVRLFYDWNLKGAEEELRRAKELDASDAQSYHFYAHYFQFAGRLDEAHSELKQAVQLDPTNLVINAELGWADYTSRHYDDAIAQFQKTLELDPTFVLASLWIAQAYEQKGMYREALDELKRAKSVDPEWFWLDAEIACVYAFSGKRPEAEEILKTLNQRRTAEYLDPTVIAYVYAALGDKEQTFVWLEKAYQERAGNIPWIKLEPKFDSMRKEPEFQDLVRRIGLPQ
ncbi:MAG TPA: protein kinase [Pyrinomonadaceae bacterium]|jgi:serine/threonine protein kinase/tetratricopeptide (TPR) repeat protein|nr:protein kinase [Pyrinomonadaceae bacterium]